MRTTKSTLKSSAFSLVELMVAMVILGVLAAVAVPNYKKYVERSKMAEAYTTLGTMRKSQITYYNENQSFYSEGQFGNTLFLDLLGVYGQPQGINRFLRSQFPLNPPIVAGTPVQFAYYSRGGSYNSSGALTSGLNTSLVLFKLDAAGDARCMNDIGNGTSNVTPQTLGAPSSPGARYDYVVIGASSPLLGVMSYDTMMGPSNDKECYNVVQMLESSSSQNSEIRSTPPIVFSYTP